jgi:hypothetical protein
MIAATMRELASALAQDRSTQPVNVRELAL